MSDICDLGETTIDGRSLGGFGLLVFGVLLVILMVNRELVGFVPAPPVSVPGGPSLPVNKAIPTRLDGEPKILTPEPMDGESSLSGATVPVWSTPSRAPSPGTPGGGPSNGAPLPPGVNPASSPESPESAAEESNESVPLLAIPDPLLLPTSKAR